MISSFLREIPDAEGRELRRHAAATIAHLSRSAGRAPGATIRDLEALISLLEQHGGVPDDLRSELAYLVKRVQSLAEEKQWQERLTRWDAHRRPDRLMEPDDLRLLALFLSVYLAIARSLPLDALRLSESPPPLPRDLFHRRRSTVPTPQ